MSDDHVVSVGPTARVELSQPAGGVPPAFRFTCSCGATGQPRTALNLGGKARNEALEEARQDAVTHLREARRRGTVDG